MCTRSLLRRLVCVSLVTFLAFWLPLSFWKGSTFLTTPAISWAISFLVILSAFYLNQWAFRKSNKVFFRALVGGMVVRIVVVVGLIFAVWWFLKLSPVLFLATLIGYYLIFQIMEAKFLQKEMGVKKRGEKSSPEPDAKV